LPTAAGLAEAIKKAFHVDSKMIEGSGGVFDVHVDGAQIWSKQDVGRFPEHKEILDKITGMTAKAR
jgi:selT/selW/selH-like putative selenoprotein